VLIAIMVSAAAMTYKIKSDAEAQQAQVHRLQAQIHTEEDTIDLLKADWSLLTQPARLQKLAELYKAQLGLEPTDAHQIVSLDDIPVRPVTIEDLTSQRLGGMADAGTDRTVTGAVR
jgi:hypothetical protein